MSYVEKNLLPGEEVVYTANLHWIVFGLPGFFLFAGVLMIVKDIAPLGAFFILVALVLALSRWIQRKTSEFAITNKRVLIKVGLVRRHSLELLLQKIEGIGVDQGIVGRLLDYGTIVVTGTGGTKEPFKTIAAPFEFRKQVQGRIPV